MRRLICGIDEHNNVIATLVDDEDYHKVCMYSWNINAGGYAARTSSINKLKINILLHHVIAGKPKNGYVVDHINRDKLDNRKENLRHVTQRQNVRNGSRYLGGIQRRSRNSWVVSLCFNKKEHAEEANAILERYRLTLEGEE